jgi:hypothetical protein
MPGTPMPRPPKPTSSPCQKHDEEFEYDSIVLSILLKIQNRARIGKKKYGTDLDRTDLNKLDWINHAQEEAMDLILYLERLKKDLQNA